jgi:hypothetical protein
MVLLSRLLRRDRPRSAEVNLLLAMTIYYSDERQPDRFGHVCHCRKNKDKLVRFSTVTINSFFHPI